jgi:hypothetical protein
LVLGLGDRAAADERGGGTSNRPFSVEGLLVVVSKRAPAWRVQAAVRSRSMDRAEDAERFRILALG